jgi:hypothetical protein
MQRVGRAPAAPQPSFKFAQELLKGVEGKLRGMGGSVGKAAKGLRKLLRGGGAAIFDRAPGDYFRQKRSAGDCARAAPAEEPHFGKAAVFDARGESQNIAANGVGDFHDGRGAGQLTGVARIPEVVEKEFAEHRQEVWQRAGKTATREAAESLVSASCRQVDYFPVRRHSGTSASLSEMAASPVCRPIGPIAGEPILEPIVRKKIHG